MKKGTKLFSKKKIWLPILITLLISVVFFAYVYFSPGEVRNFPVGTRTAQVNFTPGGVNIFFPKDDTTFYYFHNFSGPSQITGANTKLDDSQFTTEYKEPLLISLKNWIFSLFNQSNSEKIQLVKDTSEDFRPVNTSVTPSASVSETRGKSIHSEILDFTLNPPSNYKTSYEKGADYEYMTLSTTSERSSDPAVIAITIYPTSQGCTDNNNDYRNPYPVTPNIGGKYPVDLLHGSISHGDIGGWYRGFSKVENDYCIAVEIKQNGISESELVKVLEGN